MSKETLYKLQQLLLEKETELSNLSILSEKQLHIIQQLKEELRLAKKLAESASRTKTEPLSHMYHAIKAPLSSISGFSEVLQSESRDPRLREYAENLAASSQTLLQLLDEVNVTSETTPLPSANTANLTSNARILVVEDNIIAQTIAQSLLTNLSCQVDVASNGSRALELYTLNEYDLIFMDIGLGEGMDGFEVTRRIRGLSPPSQHIPIIALTGHAGDNNKQRCIEAGMDEVIIKPLTQSQAIDSIKTFIPIKQDKTLMTVMLAKKELPENYSELFNLEQYPLFDPEVALKNCGNNDVLIELLKLMISQEIPQEEERIKDAFENKEYPQVEKIAHKIKSGAMYLGTTRMKFACQYLERYWKTGERELFNELYHQAVRTIDDTSKYISEWLNKPSHM
ncbi:response regulator [uncultured Legionella sp.]|uniref:response regulator n=1 Tax=uncultured Legionella sp. TaxID=210934 RepID=UPI002622286E|nr:response regulator [uncultured Legionella sp.]